jgi:Tol biopolymer transport system component/DNA-binding winged helix-turn-helix (wHTH) protein
MIYKFGTFRVDPDERKLWDGEQQVPLAPKLFQTLLILIENRGRIVSKKELLDTIWPDCYVVEANLTQNISVLRKALQESDSATKYIITFPRKGYQFAGEVLEEPAEAPALLKPPAAPESSPGVQLLSPSPLSPRPPRRYWPIWLGAGAVVVALGIAVFALRRGKEPAPFDLGTVEAITHLRGCEYQPAISADGSKVAFVHYANSQARLRVAVVDLRSSTAPVMISAAADDSCSPAWSPDGRALAYLQARGNRHFVVLHELGGVAKDLTEVFGDRDSIIEKQLDWSPDGRLLAVCDKTSPAEPFRIELVHVADGHRTPLTLPQALSDGDFAPRFSPDGRKVAFIRVSSRAVMNLFAADVSTGICTPLTSVRQSFGGVDWTPNSQSLVFSAEANGQTRVWLLSVTESSQAWRPTTLTATRPVQLSVSRGTGRLVAADAELDENIWRARLLPDHSLAWEAWIASNRKDWFPVYSPDSTRVAFLSDRSGEQQLYIKDSGDVERQLTFGQLVPNYVSWTGDGRQMTFSSLRERQLYRLTEGGKPQLIPIEGGVGAHTAVWPDGSSVLLTRRFYTFQAPFMGGRPKLLTDQGGYPLRVSPDGKWIYHARNRFSNEIWRIRRSDQRAELVTNRLHPGCWACWAVNDKRLVYLARSEQGTAARLESMDLATGRVEPLGRLPRPLPPPGRGALALSPDNAFLLAVVADPEDSDLLLASPNLNF